MAAFLKAGFESRRCRFQTSPSLTSRPFPARLLPGKKAVPACERNTHEMEAQECAQLTLLGCCNAMLKWKRRRKGESKP